MTKITEDYIALSEPNKNNQKKFIVLHSTSKIKSAKPYSVVSFFCGCGGLDFGFQGNFVYHEKNYESLPFSISAAYDFDADCIETYKKNIGDHASKKDLSNFKTADMPIADILLGGFPCQDFATCGPRRGLDSERGKLYLSMITYMRAHKPKIAIGENVPGLENVDDGEVLETIQDDLKNCGYNVKVWKLFGPEYGLPQRRTRLFIVCVRDDLNGFPLKPPIKFHRPYKHTIKWAIEDLENIVDESVVNQSQFFKAAIAKNGNGQGDEISDPDKPAYTIRAKPQSRIQFHYKLHRRLTIRECARLQSFPDTFVFPHSATANILQIGNAVPPILGHLVAKTIAKYLGDQK